MPNLCSVFLFGFTLINIATFCNGSQWLYNAPRALFGLASSASASASVPPTPLSHIADLRKNEEKSAELEGDKQLARQAELSDTETEEAESSGDGSGDGNDEQTNEASPSFIRKKVNTILAKLRLIAQIKNAYHYNREIPKSDHNLTFNITPVANTADEQNSDKETVQSLDYEIEPIKVRSQNVQRIAPYTQYGVPKERIVFPKETSDEPTQLDLEVNELNDQLQELNELTTQTVPEPEPSKFGPLGVFFAELFGTLVGLTYGAVAQLTSGNQNPVATSTTPA